MGRRDRLLLDSSLGRATSAVARIFIHLDLAVHEKRMITLLDIVVVLIVIFLIHIRIGGREGRIDVLRLCLMLGSLSSLKAHDVCLLERTVLVKGAADEVGAVW